MRSEAEAAVSEQFGSLEAFKFSTAVARASRMLEVVPHHFTERDGDPSARAQHGREVGGGDRPHPSPSCVRISRRRRRGPHALPCVPFTPPHRAPRCCFPLPAHRNHARLTLSPPDHLASSSSGGAGTRSASLAFGAGAALGSAYTGAHPPASPVPIPRRLHRSLGLTHLGFFTSADCSRQFESLGLPKLPPKL